MAQFEKVKLKNITQDDIIIAVMGPTGAGKSTFIDIATRQDGKTVGHSMQSCTSEIRTVRVPNPKDNRPVVFVDTPAFDHTNKSDTEVLAIIAEWLEKSYKNNIRLAGIIYLHPITGLGNDSSSLKHFPTFANLCGDDAVRNVILATTMWKGVKEEVGAKREQELKEKWKSMLDNGSSTARFLGTFDSAWSIVERFVEKARVDALLLQGEIVDLHRRLGETQAGITLYNTLQTLLADRKEAIRLLREEAEGQNNSRLVRELNVQYEQIQEQLRKTFDQMEKMKIPLGKRILLLFTFKRTRTRRPKIV